jgi:peroxiredoxin
VAKTFSNHVLKAKSSAPYFKLKGIDNKIYSINDFQSKLLLIVFMCNHCPYVKAQIKDLVELQAKFVTSDLQIIGINSNDPNYQDEGFENMIKFASSNGLNFPYLIDDTQAVAKSFGAVCTPDPFLFNIDRKLVFHGRITNAAQPDATPTVYVMENNIFKLLHGEDLERDFDPSVGCSIKWKPDS